MRRKIWIGGDLNGHVGESNKGNEKCMGNYGMQIRNEEGKRTISFAKDESLANVNTYFKKHINKLITYSSSQHKMQINYFMCHRSDLKGVTDCKVIPGDYVAKQHRSVVAIISWVQKKISSMITEKKTAWRNFKIEEKKEAFSLQMKEHLKKKIEANRSETSQFMRECAERLLGVNSGKVMVEKENWWWNDKMQEVIKCEKEKKRGNTDWEHKKTRNIKANRLAKKAAAKANWIAYRDMSKSLEEQGGKTAAIIIANCRKNTSEDVSQK